MPGQRQEAGPILRQAIEEIADGVSWFHPDVLQRSIQHETNKHKYFGLIMIWKYFLTIQLKDRDRA